MNDIYSLDKMLEQICQRGRVCTNFIRDYSEEISNELESKGYINKIKSINYEEIEATEAGELLYRNGGFVGEAKRKKEEKYNKDLDIQNKTTAIETSREVVELAKKANCIAENANGIAEKAHNTAQKANTIAIIAIVLSLTVVIIEILKLIL